MTTLSYALLLLTIAINHLMIQSKLIFVYEHFRHGARGPSSGLSTDGYDYLKQYWPSRGELTPIGSRMLYVLGYLNRVKYNDFISSTYDPREILIYSTDFNRTIQSAMSHFQGLFQSSQGIKLEDSQLSIAVPPNDVSSPELQEVIKDLKTDALANRMQIGPIKIFDPSDEIYILYEASRGSGCKAIDVFRKKNIKKDIVQKAIKDFNTTFAEKFLKFYQSSDTELLMNNSYLVVLCDHLIADVTEQRDLSVLTSLGIDLGELTKSCHTILNNQLYEIVFGDKGHKVAIMSITSGIRQVLHYMHNRLIKDQNGQGNTLSYDSPKMLIHSAHDSSISGMELLFKEAFNTKLVNPIYADNLYLELKKKDEGLHNDLSDYYVEYYIRDELIKSIPYEEFRKTILEMTYEKKEIVSFCNMSHSDGLWLAIWCMAVTCSILIFSSFALYILLRRKVNKTRLIDDSINVTQSNYNQESVL